jgi:hypothetical protein
MALSVTMKPDEIEQQAASYEKSAELARNQSLHFGDLAVGRAQQIATWVLFANGSALLLCLNGLLSHNICDWPAFRSLILVFLVGFGATLVAIVLDYYALSGVEIRMTRFRRSRR